MWLLHGCTPTGAPFFLQARRCRYSDRLSTEDETTCISILLWEAAVIFRIVTRSLRMDVCGKLQVGIQKADITKQQEWPATGQVQSQHTWRCLVSHNPVAFVLLVKGTLIHSSSQVKAGGTRVCLLAWYLFECPSILRTWIFYRVSLLSWAKFLVALNN